MQFIDLAVQQKRIRSIIEANIAQVLEHGKYILGPEVTELEKRLGAFTGSASRDCLRVGYRCAFDGPDGTRYRSR